MIHDLKTWPEHFRDVRAGIKTAELRLNDRNYQPGDVLVLREYDPQEDEYTGEVETRRVSHILASDNWLQPNVVMISMSDTVCSCCWGTGEDPFPVNDEGPLEFTRCGQCEGTGEWEKRGERDASRT
ncbi:DUF3850 domain-containing protein [Brevibacillus sp. DP1.3A]|uniref:DUF3850 domain-containing protein n=1 Tax=Brevibacillus sp. DP1.3A TaxID=2738867 RepID=UPI00156BCE31|nr:DUF3850 domain-containing protein [Brevibacillus sp. DP1.3A]UED78100.1 DUF3850 domain-containing protein [Brevibacillus sp. DP1.3A]